MFHYESMDNSNQVFTQEFKDQIYAEMAETIISALESAQITVEESEKSAAFVVEKFDQITSKEQLISFLEELSNAWTVYRDLYIKVKGNDTKIEDEAKISEIQTNLDNISTNQIN
jgi:hypothetical protein